MSEGRIEDTLKIYEDRKGNNEDLTLLECVQLCDKRDILLECDEYLAQFEFTKPKFRRLLRDAEKIRNEITHSQNSIIANLDWEVFVATISNVESFLGKSEIFVELKARNQNR